MTDAVSVSWPKDRHRFARALREFPGVRRFRARVRWAFLVSAVLVVVMLWLGGGAMGVIVALLPGLMALSLYLGVRRAMLAEVGTGTMTWRVDDRGVRAEGTTATEIPWSQMVRWERRAGHLLIEVRRPNGKQPNAAMAAPLEAFSPEDWERTEAILRTRLGSS